MGGCEVDVESVRVAHNLPRTAVLEVMTQMRNTILIVDDQALQLNLLEQELTDKGYRVVRALSGYAALQQVSEIKPDGVLLDYMMPEMNGLEALRLIHNSHSQIALILLTAYYSPELENRAIKDGACAVLAKPFDPEQLDQTLRTALHGRVA